MDCAKNRSGHLNRVILNAIFPGEPQAYKRVERRGPRSFVPKVMKVAQKNLRRGLEQIAPNLKPSNRYFGVQQVFYIAPCAPTAVPDGDNLEKLLWDAMNGKIWLDDSQIIEWSGRKVLGSLEPRTHLIVYLIEGET
jgi:Holliday junction resolvase RusA-like endonuclease